MTSKTFEMTGAGFNDRVAAAGEHVILVRADAAHHAELQVIAARLGATLTRAQGTPGGAVDVVYPRDRLTLESKLAALADKATTRQRTKLASTIKRDLLRKIARASTVAEARAAQTLATHELARIAEIAQDDLLEMINIGNPTPIQKRMR